MLNAYRKKVLSIFMILSYYYGLKVQKQILI